MSHYIMVAPIITNALYIMIIISSFLWVALFAVFMHIYPCIFETALRKKKKGRKERKEERKEGRNITMSIV
jgi:phosphotransferase system  glucose/maltose/N-acetylglucosamine-specific IIC component